MPPDEPLPEEASKATSEVDQAWQELAGTPVYRRRWAQVLFALLALGGLSSIVPYPLYVTSECRVASAHRAKVHLQTDGVVAEMIVSERDQVQGGQVLARLDDSDAKRRRLAFMAQLDTLMEPPSSVRDEHATAVRMERRRLELEVAELDRVIADQLVLRAPIAGVVLTSRLAERVGSRVAAGDFLIEIADSRRMMAEILVEERDLSGIAVGQAVRVKVISHPTRVFPGTVAFIAPTVTLDPPGRMRVVAELDNGEGLLADNMNGYGEIKGDEQSILQLATRRLLGWLRVRYLL